MEMILDNFDIVDSVLDFDDGNWYFAFTERRLKDAPYDAKGKFIEKYRSGGRSNPNVITGLYIMDSSEGYAAAADELRAACRATGSRAYMNITPNNASPGFYVTLCDRSAAGAWNNMGLDASCGTDDPYVWFAQTFCRKVAEYVSARGLKPYDPALERSAVNVDSYAPEELISDWLAEYGPSLNADPGNDSSLAAVAFLQTPVGFQAILNNRIFPGLRSSREHDVAVNEDTCCRSICLLYYDSDLYGSPSDSSAGGNATG